MPKPFRSTISAKSIDELSVGMAIGRDDMPPTLQESFDHFFLIALSLLVLCWGALLVGALLLLFLLVLGTISWNATWLWAAGFLSFGSTLFLLGGIVYFQLIAAWQQPESRQKHIRAALLALSGVFGIVMLLWMAVQPIRPPLTLVDQLRLIVTGGLLIAVLCGNEVGNLRKYGWRSRPVLIRMLGAIMLSASMVLSYILLAQERDALAEWRVMQMLLQYGGLMLLLITRLPGQQPQPPSRQRTSPALLVISGLVLIVMLFFILTL
jgi:hypothetical protein